MKLPNNPRLETEVASIRTAYINNTGLVPILPYSVGTTASGTYTVVNVGNNQTLIIWGIVLGFNAAQNVANICRIADDDSGLDLLDTAGMPGSVTISSPDVETPLYVSRTGAAINLHASATSFKANATVYASII